MAENEIETKKPSILSWAALGLAAVDLAVTLISVLLIFCLGGAVIYIMLALVLLSGFLPLLLGIIAFFTAKGEKASKRNALIAVIAPLVLPIVFIVFAILRLLLIRILG